MSTDAQVAQEITTMLAGIDACRPDWNDARQIGFLRLFAEGGIDELEQAENDYYAFLETCVQLAGENMQDARLWSLESQVAELQNPRTSVGDMITDAAILLAGELLIASGFTLAVPAVVGFLARRNTARLARQLGTIAEQERTLLPQLRTLAEAAAHNDIQVRGLETMLSMPENKAVVEGIQGSLQSFYRTRSTTADARAQITAALQTNLETANRAVAARNQQNAQLGDNMKGFLHNILTHTAVGRVGEQSGPDVEAALTQLMAGAGQEGRMPFETSSIVGDVLSAVRRERTAGQREWAELRLYTRFLNDTEFLASARIHDLIARIQESRPQLAEIGYLAPIARTPFVNSFEVMLWLEWFAYNDMRGRGDNVTITLGLQVPVGRIVNGVFVKSVAPALNVPSGPSAGSGPYEAVGDFYPAIPKLNDDLTEYLYRKFARGFFSRNPGALPKPLTFDLARYDEVPAMPRDVYGVFTNGERITRLDEMRLMVAIFFNLAPERSSDGTVEPVRSLMRELMGRDPSSDPLEGWLDSLPAIPHTPSFTQPLPGQQGPVAGLAEPVEALLRDAGEQTWLVGDARSQLDNAITDLDLRISVYPLQHTSSTTPPPGGESADDALREIEEMKVELALRYSEFLRLAADQGDLVADVRATAGARLDELSNWSPDIDAGLAWQFPSTDSHLPSSGAPTS